MLQSASNKTRAIFFNMLKYRVFNEYYRVPSVLTSKNHLLKFVVL